MMRPRGGFTSYIGYGALTLILLYTLFLYNATNTNLKLCEQNVSKLKEDKKELDNVLSGIAPLIHILYIFSVHFLLVGLNLSNTTSSSTLALFNIINNNIDNNINNDNIDNNNDNDNGL